MSTLDVVVLVAAAATAAAAVGLAILVLRRREAPDAGLLMLQQQIDALRGQVTQRLDEVGRSVGERLDANLQMVGQRFTETAALVTTVHERLKGVEEAAGRIYDLGRDLASLQEILQPPKLRGGLGELLLENLLRDRLPEAIFKMQYRFSNGTVVDAVIRLADRLVPVDSKFPLEGFQAMLRSESDEERARTRREFERQVQAHVKAIAEKYILPEEGTYDFALMYVPAENVYYEAVVRGDEAGGLYQYCMERRVIPVSPTTFYAYLVALVWGLKGLQVERQAAQIREGLAHLAADVGRIREPMARLGEQIRRAQNNYEVARRALDRFGDRLQGLGGVPIPEEPEEALPLSSQPDS